jgi:hypothetical protein
MLRGGFIVSGEVGFDFLRMVISIGEGVIGNPRREWSSLAYCTS